MNKREEKTIKQIKTGEKICEILCLKKDKNNNRYITGWGNKTPLGIYLVTKRIIEEEMGGLLIEQFPTKQQL